MNDFGTEKTDLRANLVAREVLNCISHDSHCGQSKLFPPNRLGSGSYLQIPSKLPSFLALCETCLRARHTENSNLSQVVADNDGNGPLTSGIEFLGIRGNLYFRCLKPFATCPTNHLTLKKRSEHAAIITVQDSGARKILPSGPVQSSK
jgi:hypothetical protein